jgi:hypothetical protein
MNLDKWIAENVMGWMSFEKLMVYGPKEGYALLSECIATKDWHPTEDIAQAFMVVERMAEEGWRLTLEESGHWYVAYKLLSPNRAQKVIEETADTPALAICRAAYQAEALKGEKDDSN